VQIEPINVHTKEAVQDIDEAADDGGEGTRHNSGAAAAAAARARGARASISAVHTPLAAAAAAAAAASAPSVPAPGTPSSLHPQLSSLPTASSTNLVGMGSLQSDSPRSSMAAGRASVMSAVPTSAQPSARLPLMDTAIDAGEVHAIGPPSGRASMVIATSSVASPAHTAGAGGSSGFGDVLASHGEVASQGSPAGTGTPSSATGSFTRVKSRSWISNVMGRGKGGHKRSDMMGPHGVGAGHGNTGATAGTGRYSEADVRSSAGSHMGSGNGFVPGGGGGASGVLGSSGKRARARTEAGLLGSGGDRGNTRGAAADAASLWGAESGGFARRELSLASKLNIPPPVRMIGNARPTSSLALSSGVALNTAYSMMSAGSGESGSLAGLQSFTGHDAAGPTSSTLGLHPRRSIAAPPGESWASKLGNLQSGMLAGGEDMLVAERRRASYNMKPPGWEPLSEVPDEEAGGASDGDNALDRSMEGPGSNGVQVSSPSRSRLSDIRKRIFGRKAQSTTALVSAALVEAPNSGPQASNASQSNTSGSNAGLPQASAPSQPANGEKMQYEWSEDSYAVDALSSSFTNPRRPYRAGVPQTPANIGGYMAPSPLAKPGGRICFCCQGPAFSYNYPQHFVLAL
jgi:hypothetical protein